MNAFVHSMRGRVFLLLLVGILASASLTWWLAFGERQNALRQLREARLVEQAEQFVLTVEAIAPERRPEFLATTARFSLRARLENSANLPPPAGASSFAEALSERLGPEFQVAALPPGECPPPRGRRRSQESEAAPAGNCSEVAVTLGDGQRLTLMLPPPRPPTPLRPDFYIYLSLFLASIALLAYAVAKMAVRPLQLLAQAAHDLGDNLDRAPLREQGPSEIRQASAAFNAMQQRLRQHIAERTQMLAAITHDLQTPLTRLRLRLEKVADPDLRARLVQDLSSTQAIVREGLDLARSMDSPEAPQAIDLDSLLDSVCGDAAEAGQQVELEGQARMAVHGRPTALRRCLVNLVDNAVKYGGRAEVSVQAADIDGKSAVSIRIRDHGPGIDAEKLEMVFEPFHRLENSRSRATGGTGLGLTIARNIARRHGGDITLANHPEGGLTASLLLPAQALSSKSLPGASPGNRFAGHPGYRQT